MAIWAMLLVPHYNLYLMPKTRCNNVQFQCMLLISYYSTVNKMNKPGNFK